MSKSKSYRGRRHPRGATVGMLALCSLVISALAGARPLAGQTPRGGLVLPPEVAAEVIDFYNDGATLRLVGSSHIARGNEISGGIAVLGGPVTVAGRITGRLVVINGDVILEPGAAIAGDITVVGGAVRGLDAVPVQGTVVIYRAPLRFRMQGERIALAPEEEEAELATGRDFGFGRTDLLLAAHRGYNRVEGLPIVVGPRFASKSPDPIRLEALAILRTATGLELQPKRWGYLLKAEKSFAAGAFSLGATLRSEIDPIETAGLTDRENSLATFLLHRDYRDHYQREGWSARARWKLPGRPFDLALEYRDEEHSPVRARDPWTLFRGDEPWRTQPIVATGRLRSLALDLKLDTRNESQDPTTGWLVRNTIERGVGGTLAVPQPSGGPLQSGGSVSLVAPVGVDAEFAAGSLDVRRYARLGPTSRLALRAFAASSLNDRPLPPQRQRALGGSGSLPGYAAFAFDCGARQSAATYDAGTFYPYYGCDRVVLLQLEYRNDFSFGRGWGRKLGADVDLGERIGWVVFFDAGRAWIEREAAIGRGTGQSDFAADFGLGLRLGSLGLYWAVPLSGDDRSLRFSLRLGPRL